MPQLAYAVSDLQQKTSRATVHDLHHAKPNIGNYAATYVFWDRIFGSEIKG